jgi:hypothetical protein
MKQEILGQLDDLTSGRAAFEHLARHDPEPGVISGSPGLPTHQRKRVRT